MAYIILGSNSTDKEKNLVRAIALLRQRIGLVIDTSSVYATAAWGYASEKSYLNQALSVETAHTPLALLHTTQEIEQQLGRTEKSINGVYADRPIDIDILFYAEEIIRFPELTIPHPHICNRRFVLEPLDELDPNLLHPEKQQTVRQLLKVCKDRLAVKRL